MAPCQLQVAFQGGGAKLCDLVAAASAIQGLEQGGVIQVTRVAGTSAGAIAACWYATGQPLSLIRQRLIDKGPEFLSRVVPQRSVAGALTRVLLSKPIYDEKAFREVLWEWFKIAGKRFETFADFKIPVIVTAADVLNGSKHIFDEPKENVVDALAHSAGLPYVFRTTKSNSTLVDGGICENLPADELLRREDEFGKVIGISFARQQVPQRPTNPLKYGLALLDAAMGNSMDRACERIGAGFVYKIPTDITTFDFQRALGDGLGDDHFGRVSSDVRAWVQGIIPVIENDETSFIPSPNQEMTSQELMKRINEIYHRSYHDTPLVLKRSSLVVTAYCLLPKSDPRSSLADGVRQIILLNPVDKPVGCFRIGMLSTGDALVEGTLAYSVRTAQRKKIDVTLVPVSLPPKETDSALGQERQLLFFFHPALDPDPAAGPYTLTVQQDVPNALAGIPDRKGDRLSLTSDRSENIETVDLVMFLPKAFGDVELSDHRAETSSDSIPGRKMTDEELAEYGDPPAGFVPLGWRGQDLKVGQRIGVAIRSP